MLFRIKIYIFAYYNTATAQYENNFAVGWLMLCQCMAPVSPGIIAGGRLAPMHAVYYIMCPTLAKAIT